MTDFLPFSHILTIEFFLIFLKQNTIWLKTGNNRFNLTFFLNRNIYLILLTLFKFVDSVRYAVNHR
jgi:hypothetical protein